MGALAPLSAEHVLERALRFEEWAFREADDHPSIVEAVLINQKLIKILMTAHCVRSAIHCPKNPRKRWEGKNGALELLENHIPRSTLFAFVKHRLGLNDRNDLWTSESTDALIESSETVQRLLQAMEQFYERHQEAIAGTRQPKRKRS